MEAPQHKVAFLIQEREPVRSSNRPHVVVRSRSQYDAIAGAMAVTRLVWGTLVVLGFAVLATVAHSAPSFDCGVVTTAVERAICADAALSEADRELSDLYSKQRSRLTGAEFRHLQNDQVRWLGYVRRSCGGSESTVPGAALAR